MNLWKYPGAKWWKFDFHTHTPASFDFEDKSVTPEKWLQYFIDNHIECVAITDHNSGAWINKLKEALKNLQGDNPSLYLFPGVEISVQAGVHVLAIFDPSKTTADIDSLLGAVEYRGKKVHSDSVTKKSLTEVVQEIEEHKGIAIPAHVNRDKGLFQIKGNTLKQVLSSPYIHAIEICDTNFKKPQIYKEEKLKWAEVCGSDLHDLNKESRFTWVKMDKPSIEGLKLALIDGPEVSVNRNMQSQPNKYSDSIIEEITVENAKYIGRLEKLSLQFSPFLNTIIGGRGTGKSTLLEFIRLVLRRRDEIPEPLKQDNEKYFKSGDNGLLCENSYLSVIYRKGESHYRLSWRETAEGPSLEVKDKDIWKEIPGDIQDMFPVSIYSQKQIFALAQKPDALLKIIDKEPSIKFDQFDQENKTLTNKYKKLRQKIREFREKIAEENKLKGKLSDVTRQIDEIKKSGHKEVMEKYHQRQQQLSVIESLEEDWQERLLELQNIQEKITPSSFNPETFDQNKDMLEDIHKTNQEWQNINNQLVEMIKEAKNIIQNWQQIKETSQWMQSLKHDLQQYEQIKKQLEQKNINPQKYPYLLSLQDHYQKELGHIKEYDKLLKQNNEESQKVLKNIQKNREDLTEERNLFLEKILEDHQSFKMEIKPFRQKWEGVEQEIRKLLQCKDSRFEKDFKYLEEKYKNETHKINAIDQIKELLNEIREGRSEAQDKRFAEYIKGLSGESIDHLMCWFPEDSLKVTLNNQQEIEKGSPGQKTAALLTFILSYGDVPLILDQPEDDLDNELIYGLIVKKLREIKSKRQIIVVTHNANIVVNGDSEMVFPLKIHGGQPSIKNPSSIQDKNTREEICNVLEGGQEAFRQRYKRIHLEEKSHV